MASEEPPEMCTFLHQRGEIASGEVMLVEK